MKEAVLWIWKQLSPPFSAAIWSLFTQIKKNSAAVETSGQRLARRRQGMLPVVMLGMDEERRSLPRLRPDSLGGSIS
jgi:hypothetical protein